MQPKIIVLSGPSGVGKNTVLDGLLADPTLHGLTTVTKWTTRAKRDHEIDGKEFHFIPKELFEQKIKDGELLEYDFHFDNYYGVPRMPVDQLLARGQSPILIIDVNGARAVKQRYGDQALLIFLTAPLDDLKQRLIDRGQNTPDQIEDRLQRATQELLEQRWYDLVVENASGNQTNTIKQIAEQIGSQ